MMAAMKLLLFSDVHCEMDHAGRLAAMSADVDAVVGAGDFACQHHGLEMTIRALAQIKKPAVVVPGNNETDETLARACAEWPAARVLHGNGCEIDGVSFFGLGGGIPTTPWSWSFDLSEPEAAAALDACRSCDVLVLHSPPLGHADTAGGEHFGSAALLAAIERLEPKLAVCGHIHDSWETQTHIGPTLLVNAGPGGVVVEV